MECVHIVQRQHVDVFFHKFHREEMAAHVEVHASICETRLIVDHRRRQQKALALRLSRQRLAQSLDAVKHSLRSLSLNHHSRVGNSKPITLLVGYGRIDCQHNGVLGLLSLLHFLHGQRQAHRLAHILRQKLSIALQRQVASRVSHHSLCIETERFRLSHFYFAWQRHNCVGSNLLSLCVARRDA